MEKGNVFFPSFFQVVFHRQQLPAPLKAYRELKTDEKSRDKEKEKGKKKKQYLKGRCGQGLVIT